MLNRTAVLLGLLLVSATPDEVAFDAGIEFAKAGGESLQLNLARPRNPAGKTPAILCIHGGGFRAGKREGWDARCKLLAEHGYVAATVTYRLAPKHPSRPRSRMSRPPSGGSGRTPKSTPSIRRRSAWSGIRRGDTWRSSSG